jgi:DNA repair protein RadA/Sms
VTGRPATPGPVLYACPHCRTKHAAPVSRCPACGRWIGPVNAGPDALVGGAGAGADEIGRTPPRDPAGPIAEIAPDALDRIETGIDEFDRVVGGGLVRGGAYLVAGLPGRGKTTLCLQVAAALARALGPVLYLSAGLPKPKIAALATRIDALDPNLYVLAADGIEEAAHELVRLEAAALVVDYIQKVRTAAVEASPGSVPQVREVSVRLVDGVARAKRITVIAVGEIDDSGAIAGPAHLRYLYDAILRLDDETLPGYLLLRAEKNAYGPAAEIGVFRLTPRGLVEVPNPSAEILKTRRGTGCLFVAMEGARAIATEAQVVLLERTGLGPAIVGYPRGRLQVIRYALDRFGVRVPASIALNVLGGYKVADPAADLAVAIVLASSVTGRPASPDLAAIGEVDLAGRVLPVPNLATRLRECEAIGIPRVLVAAAEDLPPTTRDLRPVRTLAEALREVGIEPPAPAGRPTRRPGRRPRRARPIVLTVKRLARDRAGAKRRRRRKKAGPKAAKKRSRRA